MLRSSSGRLRAAVFDCDGLLVDSADCWQAAYRSLLSRSGRALDSTTRGRLNGASVSSAAIQLGLDPHELRDALGEEVRRQSVVALAGAEALLAALDGRVRLGVATNGPAGVANELLARLGFRQRFEQIISAESVAREKPAPDVYLAACEALEVDPAQAVAFEDSAAGAKAARSAGLVVVLVPSGEDPTPDFDFRADRLDDPGLLEFLGLEHSGISGL